LGGEARLLLPVSASERTPRIPETPTLQVRDAIYTLEGVSGRFIDLTCLVRDLECVFAEVATEIISRIGDGHSAINACVSTLSEFRLLLVPRSSLVAPTVVTGLVGELLLLNDLLDKSADACSLWRGPLGERHDFRGGKLAIEVKTTSRAGNQVVPISAIDQLLEPMHGELCLVHYTLEPAAGAQFNVASLFRRAIERVVEPLILRDLLDRLGCSDPLSDAWNANSYELQDSRSYRVAEGFPRIVPGSFIGGGMQSGVAELTYSTDLAGADQWRLTEQESFEFKKKMIACL
jgi:hypothetical protein